MLYQLYIINSDGESLWVSSRFSLETNPSHPMISPKKRFERAGSTEPGIQLTEVAAMKVLGETFSMVPEDFNVGTHQITENI